MDESGSDPSLEVTLRELATGKPRLAERLLKAEAQRRQQVHRLSDGRRFRALEELLVYLDRVEQVISVDQVLRPIAFLVKRATHDIETAIEATVSGYFSVAADTMRDVMEIEHLLLDFSTTRAKISEWLEADRRTLLTTFKPSEVRKRCRREGVLPPNKVRDMDYAAHSQALHVGPSQGWNNMVSPRGFGGETVVFGSDHGFWELFEHSRRLLVAIDRLRDQHGDASVWNGVTRMEDLADFRDGWEAVMEMQDVFLALLDAVQSQASAGEAMSEDVTGSDDT